MIREAEPEWSRRAELIIDPACVQRIADAIPLYDHPELILTIDLDGLVGAGPIPASTKLVIQEAPIEAARL